MTDGIDGRLLIAGGLSSIVFLEIAAGFVGAMAGAPVAELLALTFPATIALWAIVIGFCMASGAV